MEKAYTFTKKYSAISKILTLPVKIRLAGTDKYYKTHGIIDTGAIVSIVSKNLVNKLSVMPHSYQFMDTASEQKIITPVYRASMILCDQIEITNLTVGDGILPEGEECLIGMDILSLGDLAVTHFESKTWLSFRIPSLQSIELKEIIQ
jgi:predicted aspartyl protease